MQETQVYCTTITHATSGIILVDTTGTMIGSCCTQMSMLARSRGDLDTLTRTSSTVALERLHKVHIAVRSIQLNGRKFNLLSEF